VGKLLIKNSKNTNMKKWYQSKMMWANIVTALLGLFEIVDYLQDSPVIPEKYKGILTLIAGIGNIYLRKITNTGIGREVPWVVYNPNTGLYLTGIIDTRPTQYQWGALADALIFNEADATARAAAIGGGTVGTRKPQ
jgi:hypothetical protein